MLRLPLNVKSTANTASALAALANITRPISSLLCNILTNSYALVMQFTVYVNMVRIVLLAKSDQGFPL